MAKLPKLEIGETVSHADARLTRFSDGMRVRTNLTTDAVAENGGEWIEGTVWYEKSCPTYVVLADCLDHEGRPVEKRQIGDAYVQFFYINSTLDSDAAGPGTVTAVDPNAPRKGKVEFDSVILAGDKKESIMEAISQVENTSVIFDEWGFSETFEKGTAVSLLFYGIPGTGKTLMAQAVADRLGLRMKVVGSAEIESSEPGQAERNLAAFFKEAEKKNQLLLFDECDSLIADRSEVGHILAAQVNALLTSLERYNGVVIFTTNRLGHMDPAFERRVSAKIEFPFPDRAQRKEIWKRMIPEKAPIAGDVDFDHLAEFPLPGGNIKNAVLSAARSAAYEKSGSLTMEHFRKAVTREIEGIKGFEAAFKDAPRRPSLARNQGASAVTSVGVDLEKAMSRSYRVEKLSGKFKDLISGEEGGDDEQA